MKKDWRSKGLFFVGDLLKGNVLLSQAEIKLKYGISVNVIDYNSMRLKMASPLSLIKNKKASNESPAIPPRTYLVTHSRKLSQVISQTLLAKLNAKNEDISRKIENKWVDEIGSYQSGTLGIMRQITLSTSLQSLHYRLVNRILPTNTFLERAGLSDSNLCTFCQAAPETPGHLFVKCQTVQRFSRKIQALLRHRHGIDVSHEQILRIFPENDERKIVGLIMIIAIQCIWLARLDERVPEEKHFESALKNHYRIEKHISKMNGTDDRWNVKWNGLCNME